jgi:hypothetical protein
VYRDWNTSQTHLRKGIQINVNMSLQRPRPPTNQCVSPRSLSKLISRFLGTILGETFHQIVSNRITVVYEIEASAETVAGLVQELETHKAEFEIADWGLSQATLDDVFIRLCGNSGHEG